MYFVSLALEGSAFGARLPSDQMTAQEASCFQDISQGTTTMQKTFLYVRNRIVCIFVYFLSETCKESLPNLIAWEK